MRVLTWLVCLALAPVAMAGAAGTFAIVHADVYPVTSGVIRDGTILVRDGKIVAVGGAVELPKGCPVIDAGGKPVLPGFVAVRTTGIGVGRVTVSVSVM